MIARRPSPCRRPPTISRDAATGVIGSSAPTQTSVGLSMRPSEIFRRQCFISFEPVEKSLPLLADYLGSDNILWATDYPHLDGFTDAPNIIKAMGLPSQTLANVLAGGAKRYYGLQ